MPKNILLVSRSTIRSGFLRRLPGLVLVGWRDTTAVPRLLLPWGLDHRSGGVLGEEHGHRVARASLFAADIDEELVDVGNWKQERGLSCMQEGPLARGRGGLCLLQWIWR
jgi:hypothetical protein